MVDAFVGVNAGQCLERGEKRAIVLLFNDAEYPAIKRGEKERNFNHIL